MKALLALEDGKVFKCRSFTGAGETYGELVFNTSITGYQEIITDPSYKNQLVIMTYPLIGAYGVNNNDAESDKIYAAGLIVKEYQDNYSNCNATDSLKNYLRKNNILGIEDIDTRAVTLHIRKAGAMRAVASTLDTNPDSLIKKAKKIDKMAGTDLVKEVGTSDFYILKKNKKIFLNINEVKSFRKNQNNKPFVAAYDFGIKYNIIREIEKSGCNLIIVPASTDAAIIKKINPDGILLSNGPGDPAPVTYAVQTIKDLLDYRPIFGICLGHQLLALSLGAKTYKLKFGHRGANHPVKNLTTGKVEITSQNHGFAVAHNSFDSDIDITHINLNDNTVEGFKHKKISAMSVQYHPEASPGPNDSKYLFKQFVKMMDC
ncbi:MAG: glutamine-hydrolyzing carbamoyl-phosphate synthase small subunit [Deltaproteobacteria bacterium]|nr:glutamine-hydrolyzing carbamoyl-phosphate synthase small subunit [Deltaproteobacteria bacterium]